MTDLVSGAIGSVGKYDVAFTAGSLVVSGNLAVSEGSLALSVTVSAKQVIDALAAKLGGSIPAEIAQVLEAALGA